MSSTPAASHNRSICETSTLFILLLVLAHFTQNHAVCFHLIFPRPTFSPSIDECVVRLSLFLKLEPFCSRGDNICCWNAAGLSCEPVRHQNQHPHPVPLFPPREDFRLALFFFFFFFEWEDFVFLLTSPPPSPQSLFAPPRSPLERSSLNRNQIFGQAFLNNGFRTTVIDASFFSSSLNFFGATWTTKTFSSSSSSSKIDDFLLLFFFIFFAR